MYYIFWIPFPSMLCFLVLFMLCTWTSFFSFMDKDDNINEFYLQFFLCKHIIVNYFSLAKILWTMPALTDLFSIIGCYVSYWGCYPYLRNKAIQRKSCKDTNKCPSRCTPTEQILTLWAPKNLILPSIMPTYKNLFLPASTLLPKTADPNSFLSTPTMRLVSLSW